MTLTYNMIVMFRLSPALAIAWMVKQKGLSPALLLSAQVTSKGDFTHTDIGTIHGTD